MLRRLPPVGLLVLCACGGSPTSPQDSGAVQGLLNSMSPDIKLNGVAVAPGSTINVTVGASITYLITFTNNSGQTLHYGLLFVRDDGVESLALCGATSSGGGSGGFGTSTSIFSNHPFFTPGRTVRVLVIGAFGPSVSGPGQCVLELSQGVANHANIQAERLLVTLSVQ